MRNCVDNAGDTGSLPQLPYFHSVPMFADLSILLELLDFEMEAVNSPETLATVLLKETV